MRPLNFSQEHVDFVELQGEDDNEWATGMFGRREGGGVEKSVDEEDVDGLRLHAEENTRNEGKKINVANGAREGRTISSFNFANESRTQPTEKQNLSELDCSSAKRALHQHSKSFEIESSRQSQKYTFNKSSLPDGFYKNLFN